MFHQHINMLEHLFQWLCGIDDLIGNGKTLFRAGLMVHTIPCLAFAHASRCHHSAYPYLFGRFNSYDMVEFKRDAVDYFGE